MRPHLNLWEYLYFVLKHVLQHHWERNQEEASGVAPCESNKSWRSAVGWMELPQGHTSCFPISSLYAELKQIKNTRRRLHWDVYLLQSKHMVPHFRSYSFSASCAVDFLLDKGSCTLQDNQDHFRPDPGAFCRALGVGDQPKRSWSGSQSKLNAVDWAPDLESSLISNCYNVRASWVGHRTLRNCIKRTIHFQLT